MTGGLVAAARVDRIVVIAAAAVTTVAVVAHTAHGVVSRRRAPIAAAKTTVAAVAVDEVVVKLSVVGTVAGLACFMHLFVRACVENCTRVFLV